MPREVFEVSIDGFSGPLDLLCHLVESRQMQASRIKVAHLVRIYGAYLARTRSASAETIAEFFFMAAGLLLEKTRSLLPESAPGAGTDGEDLDSDIDEEAFLETLARYRPYREAARWLWGRRERGARRAQVAPRPPAPVARPAGRRLRPRPVVLHPGGAPVRGVPAGRTPG